MEKTTEKGIKFVFMWFASQFFKLNTIFILLRIIKLIHLFECTILTGGLFKTCVTCNTGNVIIDNIGKDTFASKQ